MGSLPLAHSLFLDFSVYSGFLFEPSALVQEMLAVEAVMAFGWLVFFLFKLLLTAFGLIATRRIAKRLRRFDSKAFR